MELRRQISENDSGTDSNTGHVVRLSSPTMDRNPSSESLPDAHSPIDQKLPPMRASDSFSRVCVYIYII